MALKHSSSLPLSCYVSLHCKLTLQHPCEQVSPLTGRALFIPRAFASALILVPWLVVPFPLLSLSFSPPCLYIIFDTLNTNCRGPHLDAGCWCQRRSVEGEKEGQRNLSDLSSSYACLLFVRRPWSLLSIACSLVQEDLLFKTWIFFPFSH